jgi:hypothetical protein
MDAGLARQTWHGLETINAVTYFSPECLRASEDLGLKGFWMGYFANRAAPLGAVGPELVEATFFRFHAELRGQAFHCGWRR